MITTTQQSQITFKTDIKLKEKTLSKVKKEGVTLKALLTMAMREYINNNLTLRLKPKDTYWDPVFANKEVVKAANQLSKLLEKEKL